MAQNETTSITVARRSLSVSFCSWSLSLTLLHLSEHLPPKVRLLKLGKVAKTRALQRNAAANAAAAAAVAALEAGRAEHLVAAKPTRRLDFDFEPEDRLLFIGP
jgi:hypothetical protein